MTTWYQKNKERVKEQRRARYLLNKSEENRKSREHFHNMRMSLLHLLGAKCVRCGITDIRVLQLDHIEGGGVHERWIRFKGNNNMLHYYVKHPEEALKKLQLLCANCNVIKVHENRENWNHETRKKAKTRQTNRNLFEFMPEEAEPKIQGQRRPAYMKWHKEK